MELREIKRNETGTGLLIERDGFIDMENSKILKEASVHSTTGEWYIPFPFIVSALFQRAEAENANGRIYTRPILEREVNKFQTFIRERRAVAENDHPPETVLSINNLSLNVIELHFEGNNVVGQMEILLSPGYVKHGIVSTRGDLLANLIYFNKIKLGVSSRGVGSVETKGGKTIVGNDFELIGFDAVTSPSTNNAWIGLTPNDIKPYLESNISNSKKERINEKLNKISHLLL
jgi:hypothetical protein